MTRLATLTCLTLCISFSTARALETPFQPLSAAEQHTAFDVVSAHFRGDPALPDAPLLFPFVALAEPLKASVLAHKPGPRRAEVHVLHHPSNRAWVALVQLGERRLAQLRPVQSGQPALADSEFKAAEALVRAHEPWQRALAARGLDPTRAFLDIWAGGESRLTAAQLASASHGEHTRLLTCLTFAKQTQREGRIDTPYDRPVEGLVVALDMNARRVLALSDDNKRPVSRESGHADKPVPLKPLRVSEPEGSELTVEGRLVRYRNWQFYAVLHPREGLVLYDVRFRDPVSARLRRIAYRLSLSEIYVPYGIADASWEFRHALDFGEYNAGAAAQRLELGHDVPENARLLDAVFFADVGPSTDNPDGHVDLPGTLAIFERSAGLAWTRTEPGSRQRDSRDARELVAAWNCWLGNYIYAFEWAFKLDGSIEVRAQLHGTTLNRGSDGKPEASAPIIARDAQGVSVAAPHHQHFLSFRLDLDIDGADNQLMEMEIAPLGNPQWKSAFDTRTTMLTQEGFRDVEPVHARHWHVESASTKNAFGKPTGYALEPGSLAFPYAAPDFDGLARAAFAQHALWFTRQRDAERFATGEFPNQSDGKDGVGAFVTGPEPLRGQDVVLWYTTGFTHIARPEDYPVMPGESVHFKLEPRGFFDRNPALDIAAWR